MIDRSIHSTSLKSEGKGPDVKKQAGAMLHATYSSRVHRRLVRLGMVCRTRYYVDATRYVSRHNSSSFFYFLVPILFHIDHIEYLVC